MRNNALLLTLVFSVILTWFIASCYGKPEFSNVPVISNPMLTQSTEKDCTLLVKDIIRIKVDFQDGDGDLGLDPTDSNPPFNVPTPPAVNFYYTNYKVKVFQKVGTQFVPFVLPDPTFTYDQRFPRLDEKDRINPLQGTLTNKIGFTQNTFPANTILKFRIQILDRSLNLSNEIETDTVTVNRR